MSIAEKGPPTCPAPLLATVLIASQRARRAKAVSSLLSAALSTLFSLMVLGTIQRDLYRIALPITFDPIIVWIIDG
jgi:hypothetical protein